MEVKLLQIDIGDQGGRTARSFQVRVLLMIDGQQEWHTIAVRPNVLEVFDASLLIPSETLEERFRLEQYALHRICRLVGQEIRGRAVRLPQFVAA